MLQTVFLSKGKLAKPMRVTDFDKKVAFEEIKKEIDLCVKNSVFLVAVFCMDDFYKAKIEELAKKARASCIYTAFLYIMPKDIPKEKDLLDKITNVLEGDTNDISGKIQSEEELDDIDIDDGFDFYAGDDYEGYELFEGGRLKKEDNEENEVKHGKKDEEDDYFPEFLGVGNGPMQDLVFNPPDRNYVKDFCLRWNYTMGKFFCFN